LCSLEGLIMKMLIMNHLDNLYIYLGILISVHSMSCLSHEGHFTAWSMLMPFTI